MHDWLNQLLGFGGAFWVAHGAERYLSVSTSAGVLVLLGHALVHQLQRVEDGFQRPDPDDLPGFVVQDVADGAYVSCSLVAHGREFTICVNGE